SYASAPMPRMTNTFMLAGDSTPDEILRSVDRGLYAVSFGGGQVDITSGKFVFSASEAYLIEHGQVTRPVKGATLIGNGPDVLTRISMVGHDLQLDEGIGTCGKDGQAVPVGVGIPTIKVDRLTVGGTAKKDPGGFMQQLKSPMSTELATENRELKTDLPDLAQDIVRRAMAGGATAAECVVREGDEFSTLVRLGQVETLKEAGSRS